MAAVIWSVSLALGCCLLFTHADAADCTHYAAVGKRYEVPLEQTLESQHRLRWTQFSTTVYDKKKNVNKYSVTTGGNLILPEVTLKDGGDYTWVLLLVDGSQVATKTLKLCVLGMVSKPTVEFRCDERLKKVEFNCNGTQPDGAEYAWYDGSGVAIENKRILVRTSKQLKSNSFFCKVSNRVSSERSDPVQPDCFKTHEEDDNLLFGLDFWLMIGILAGGGGLVLVLIVATIVCCSINRRRRRLRIKDEQELRLQWSTGAGTNQRPQNSQYVNQRSHAHPQGHSPRPGAGPPTGPSQGPSQGPTQGPTRSSAGNTGPRPPKARQNRPRPPDPITGQPLPGPRRLPQTGQTQIPVDDEENPPPLPQPRKKGPRRTQKQ